MPATTRKGGRGNWWTTTVPWMAMLLATSLLHVGVQGQSGPVTTVSTRGLGADYDYVDTGVTPTSTNTGPGRPGIEPPGGDIKTKPATQPTKTKPGGATIHAGNGLFYPLYGDAIRMRPGQRFPGVPPFGAPGVGGRPPFGAPGVGGVPPFGAPGVGGVPPFGAPGVGGVPPFGSIPMSNDYWDSPIVPGGPLKMGAAPMKWPHPGMSAGAAPMKWTLPGMSAAATGMQGPMGGGVGPNTWWRGGGEDGRPWGGMPVGNANGPWGEGYPQFTGPMPGAVGGGAYYGQVGSMNARQGLQPNMPSYYGEQEDGGYWYNGTYHYGMEMEGPELEDGYWYNGTFYYGREMEGPEMEDGYWYNGTFHYRPEMDDGYWYNGTFYYGREMEGLEMDDGYWYNGTFHYMPEMEDGYWYNGTFHYMPEMEFEGPEYDEGYWHNGTFHYMGDMEGPEMMEDGYWYNGTFYPGLGERDEMYGGYGGYGGYGEEAEEGGGLMWWQRHHPRWRDTTNDAIVQNPGVGGAASGTTNTKLNQPQPQQPTQSTNSETPMAVVTTNRQQQLPPPPPERPMKPQRLHSPDKKPQPPSSEAQQNYRGQLAAQSPHRPRSNHFQQQHQRQPTSPETQGQRPPRRRPGQRARPSPSQRQRFRQQPNQAVRRPTSPNSRHQPIQQHQGQPRQPPPPPHRNHPARPRVREGNLNPRAPQRSPRLRQPPSAQDRYIEKNPIKSRLASSRNRERQGREQAAIAASSVAAGGGILASLRRPPAGGVDRLADTRNRGGGGAGGGGSVDGKPPPPPPARGPMDPSSNAKAETRPRVPRPYNGPGARVNHGMRGNSKSTPRGFSPQSHQLPHQGNLSPTVNKQTAAINSGSLRVDPNPTVVRKQTSPLDPYRTSPATTMGILFASIVGFLLILSPLVCLIQKYRRQKRTRKRTFLRRPELGSVDEGIMDAMVRTELGEVGGVAGDGGAKQKSGSRKNSRGNGKEKNNGAEVVKLMMMEDVRSKDTKSRRKGDGRTATGEDEGGDRRMIYTGKREREGTKGRKVGGGRSEATSSQGSSFLQSHEQMRREMARMPREDEGEGRRVIPSRPHTVVGLMSDSEDI